MKNVVASVCPLELTIGASMQLKALGVCASENGSVSPSVSIVGFNIVGLKIMSRIGGRTFRSDIKGAGKKALAPEETSCLPRSRGHSRNSL